MRGDGRRHGNWSPFYSVTNHWESIWWRRGRVDEGVRQTMHPSSWQPWLFTMVMHKRKNAMRALSWSWSCPHSSPWIQGRGGAENVTFRTLCCRGVKLIWSTLYQSGQNGAECITRVSSITHFSLFPLTMLLKWNHSLWVTLRQNYHFIESSWQETLGWFWNVQREGWLFRIFFLPTWE